MLQITMITTALLAVVNLWIGLRVAQLRVKERVAVGDAGNASLTARMRAHANFSEYVPMALLLMALIEYAGGARPPLAAAGALLLVARIFHPFGMDRPAPNSFRAISTLATLLVTIALAAWALTLAYA